MVAAWMSAETGVGPSIASSSQAWSGNWAGLAAGAQQEQQADRGQWCRSDAPEALADHR